MSDDLSHRMRALSNAVDDVLIASHGLAHDLAQYHAARNEPMPPFSTDSGELTDAEKRESALAAAMRYYGPQSPMLRPMLRLWAAMRALDELRSTLCLLHARNRDLTELLRGLLPFAEGGDAPVYLVALAEAALRNEP